MKKSKILILVLVIAILNSCDVTNTNSVEVLTPGSLKNILSPEELKTKTNLTIIGKIDARDFVTLRDHMPKLEELDLSAVLIFPYSGKEGTELGEDGDYPSHTIPSSAFYENKTLKIITLPTTLTTLSSLAFSGCSGLMAVEIPETVSDIDIYVFENCTSLVSITIPPKVTNIDEGTFFGCSNLTTVTIPSSIKMININAFKESPNINKITIYATNPPVMSPWLEELDNEFFETEIYQTSILYVPVSTKHLYETANVWKNFKSIVEI